jgi:hypothetical protein
MTVDAPDDGGAGLRRARSSATARSPARPTPTPPSPPESKADVPAPADRQPRLRHRAAMLEGFNRHYRLFRETSRAAKRASSGRLARPAARAARAHRVLRQARGTRRWSGCSASSRRRAVDGHLAAGQAALHRPADQPPPARAGRDLLQLGHRQAAAPQLLPQRLHLRAPGGQHRVHRERRAGAPHLPRLLPDPTRCATPGAHRHELPAARALRGPGPRHRQRAAAPERELGGFRRAPTSRSRCCPACSSATRAPTWSARSSTASRDAVRAAHPARARRAGAAGDRRRAVRRGRPADAVQLCARLLHGDMEVPSGLRAVPALA